MKKVVALHIITTKAWEISPSSYVSLKPRRFVPHWNLFHCLKTRGFFLVFLFCFVLSLLLFGFRLLVVVGWLWFVLFCLFLIFFFQMLHIAVEQVGKTIDQVSGTRHEKMCSHLCSNNFKHIFPLCPYSNLGSSFSFNIFLTEFCQTLKLLQKKLSYAGKVYYRKSNFF